MNNSSYCIVFFDNSISHIFKTIDLFKNTYPNVYIFNQEIEFFEFIEKNDCDIIFLNLDLSPNDAILITKEIKTRNVVSKPFVVIYSDKQDDFAQEVAFNSGVDSFINFHAKPAVMNLFLKNILKRRIRLSGSSSKEVILDEEKYLIFNKGTPIQLPRKEFKVFELLYNTPDKFFSKLEIASLLWLDESVAAKRTIDVHIYNIRKLFGKRIIQSQKGKGYRINKKIIG
ncbi:MAG: winged helix-turn-helix domain-containing protein [Bacteroidota bacterium]|nr:winged helix-turn-helix domain-containing protein [Bacteroidota bacterium]MDP3146698.1 winged helix-turn-helix domain-containing protein [Bacteroidota bacterium]